MPSIFLHIPKAGGSTLRRVLEEQYSSDEIYEISRVSMYKSINEFKQLSSIEKYNVKLLMGHMDFGLHEEFGDKNVKYFTMLRDPIRRVVSNYQFILRSPYHPHYDRIVNDKMTILEYVTSGINENINNGMVKNITNINSIEDGYEAEAVKAAIESIDSHFLFVGLMEHFDESLLLLYKKLNWNKLPHYFIRKQGGTSSKMITDELSLAIYEKNKADVELYRLVVAKFEKECQEHRDFLNELLPEFKEKNKNIKESFRIDTLYQKIKFPLQKLTKTFLPRSVIEKYW